MWPLMTYEVKINLVTIFVFKMLAFTQILIKIGKKSKNCIKRH